MQHGLLSQWFPSYPEPRMREQWIPGALLKFFRAPGIEARIRYILQWLAMPYSYVYVTLP